MADLPDPTTRRDTPIVQAYLPSFDLLARRGILSSFRTLRPSDSFSHVNALLSILGYDLNRGIPSVEQLMEFGLSHGSPITDYPSLHPFIIPGFSGHGLCVTTSAWVRGAAKCALLRPVDIYSPGSSDADILDTLAHTACRGIVSHDFVLVYVDSPLKASLRGDHNAKIAALELIDTHLINPIADFIWKSDLMIHLAVTTDLVTPWHSGNPVDMKVPVITYFNNNDHAGNPEDFFSEVNAMFGIDYFENPSDLIKYLCRFNVKEEDV